MPSNPPPSVIETLAAPAFASARQMSVFIPDDNPADANNPSPSSIFLVDGQPLKFFIQKDIHIEIRDQLQDQIQALGGTCETKVPIRGYIIYQRDTPEAQRLRDCWQKPDRPDRHFVPISWIEASRQKGKPIPQVFVDKATAKPIKLHIHRDIANLNHREELTQTIANHGGETCPSEDDARIILASAETDYFKEMRKVLQGNSRKFVEHLKWLETCIQQEMYYNSPNPMRNPGGRRPGDERTAFTEEDEINLCNWIATVIPFKESGGRTGNKIYQELVSRAHVPGYDWVNRHTWQSWRERYKKNAARLDQHISAIVALNQTTPHDKAQFGFFRLTESRAPNRKRKRKNDSGSGMEQIAETPVTSENGTVAVSQTQSSQESEWAIREGNALPPEWAKRTIVNDEPNDDKRQRMEPATFRTFILAPAPDFGSASSSTDGQNANIPTHNFTSATEFAADFGAPGAMHPIDRAILDIAHEFQFVPGEVREYYDRTGDLNTTRQRFERRRALLNTMP